MGGWGGGVKSLCFEGFELGSGKTVGGLNNPHRQLPAGIRTDAQQVVRQTVSHSTNDYLY